jgi:pilus assembly protein Flp/PilA
MMNKLLVKAQVALNSFKKDTSGASLVEYSLLIGLITVAVVATIVVVGQWVGTQWTNLDAAINTP